MGIVRKIKNVLSEIRAPAVDINDEQVLEWLGITTRSKRKIAEVTYFTCMKMLSETMGKLPIKFYQETEKGKIRADPDDMTLLLTHRPNPIMTPTTLWSSVEFNCQHFGNAYVWIQREFKRKKYGGEVENKGLWLLPSSDVTVLIDDAGVLAEKGKLYYRYIDTKSGEIHIFLQEDIMHFKTWYSLNGIMGEPVRNIIGATIDGALESQNVMNKLYEQGMTASMALQYLGDFEDGKIEAIKKKFADKLSGSKNAGKVVPVPIGLQLTPLNVTMTDAQFFELRKYSALQIAGAFGIKPNQVNDYEKSSYANSEMQQLDFLVNTMHARIKMYEEEINSKCPTDKQQQEGFFYKLNEKAILRTDSKTQMQILTSAVNNGLYTSNEGREYLDKPWMEGGDILMMNGNYIPITMVGEQYRKGGENGANNAVQTE